MKRILLIMGILVFVLSVASPAVIRAAEPITIDYVTFVPAMHGISKVLLEDLQEIEKKSGGRLKFNYRGGPEAMKVPAQAMGVKDGAVDMAMTSPDFFGKMVKGLEALDLSMVPVAKHKEVGLYDYINTKFNPVGIQFLIMVPKEQGTMFHFYSKKPIEKVADFKGLSVAGTGIFDDVGPALGMTPVATEMAEQYTSMEKGVIDVCRGGLDSVMQFKFYEVAKYIINPSFGSAPASLFINLNKWNSLPKDLQDLFVNSLYEMAPASEKKHKAIEEGALKAALGNGMQVIELKDKDKFLKIVNDALYQRSAKDDPEVTKKIYELTH
jgi:TRAP-type C4-dicarboxylate transport system substrate-binding protein